MFMQQRPLSTVLMLRDRLCQRCFCPHEAALGHPCAWRPGQAHSWTPAVAELGNGGAPSRGWRDSRFMALGGERTEKRTLHTPLTETMDGHWLQTQASACWEKLQAIQRASLSSADPRLEEAEGLFD